MAILFQLYMNKSTALGSNAANTRTLLLKKECRVVKNMFSIKSRLGQRLQNLHEIVKSRSTGQSTNDNACFSSAVVQGDCDKLISASDKKKKWKGLKTEKFDTVFRFKLTKEALKRCINEIVLKNLKAHKIKELQGPRQALLTMMYALPPKNNKIQ